MDPVGVFHTEYARLPRLIKPWFPTNQMVWVDHHSSGRKLILRDGTSTGLQNLANHPSVVAKAHLLP